MVRAHSQESLPSVELDGAHPKTVKDEPHGKEPAAKKAKPASPSPASAVKSMPPTKELKSEPQAEHQETSEPRRLCRLKRLQTEDIAAAEVCTSKAKTSSPCLQPQSPYACPLQPPKAPSPPPAKAVLVTPPPKAPSTARAKPTAKPELTPAAPVHVSDVSLLKDAMVALREFRDQKGLPNPTPLAQPVSLDLFSEETMAFRDLLRQTRFSDKDLEGPLADRIFQRRKAVATPVRQAPCPTKAPESLPGSDTPAPTSTGTPGSAKTATCEVVELSDSDGEGGSITPTHLETQVAPADAEAPAAMKVPEAVAKPAEAQPKAPAVVAPKADVEQKAPATPADAKPKAPAVVVPKADAEPKAPAKPADPEPNAPAVVVPKAPAKPAIVQWPKDWSELLTGKPGTGTPKQIPAPAPAVKANPPVPVVAKAQAPAAKAPPAKAAVRAAAGSIVPDIAISSEVQSVTCLVLESEANALDHGSYKERQALYAKFKRRSMAFFLCLLCVQRQQANAW